MAPAHGVESFVVAERHVFSSGDAGGVSPWSYACVRGTLTVAIDPRAPHNRVIRGLTELPTCDDGLVRACADVVFAAPEGDNSAFNGTALLDVVNRGMPLLWATCNNLPFAMRPLSEGLASGDAHLIRSGFTYVACGWQADVRPRPNALRLTSCPTIPRERRASVRIMTEIDPSTQFLSLPGMPKADPRVISIASPGHTPPTPCAVQDGAKLFVASSYRGEDRVEIDRAAWRFGRYASPESDACVDDSASVCLVNGETFKKGCIYTLVYDVTDVSVPAVAMAVLRDCALWLKSGSASLAAALPVRACARVCAIGASQSGRLLRSMIHAYAIVGADGSEAIDGIGVWGAGASQMSLNVLAGQPSQALPHMCPFQFPFAPADARDSATGERGSLHATLAARNSRVKVMYVNASTEYHRGDASLTHVSPDGTADLDVGITTRVHLLAGCPHSPFSQWPPSHADGMLGVRLQQSLTNVIDARPVYRALVASLHAWVSGERDAPASRVPTLAHGTLVPAAKVYERFESVPGAHAPAGCNASRLWSRDFGVREDGTCAHLPPIDGDVYEGSLVPLTDDRTGNEIAGVRIPLVSVPLASHTGWARRHVDFGGDHMLTLLTGSLVPLPRTPTEAQAAGDPRAAISELYPGGRDDYLARIREASRALIVDGFLLDEDAEAFVPQAERLWDWIHAR